MHSLKCAKKKKKKKSLSLPFVNVRHLRVVPTLLIRNRQSEDHTDDKQTLDNYFFYLAFH